MLDIGCGKGFQLFELTQILPELEVWGIDISEYAIANGKEELRERLKVCSVLSYLFRIITSTLYFP